ncbi:MAG TPA: LysR family transcriptional regulator [Candidatus Limnocylindria bacterium]|nr:LysR family transcriptional regulator [Candidatus Limnocylindria bacterium]
MNVNMLRTFVRVVEIGSITRAARSLYLAQSAVSAHVAALATYAGGALLERRDGQLVLTRRGRIVYEGALEILAGIGALERRLREADGAHGDTVALTCTRTVCETALAGLVGAFGAAHPEVRLVVSGGTRKDAELRLRAGEIDLALVEGADAIVGMRLVPFQQDRLLLAVPATHPLAVRRSVRFEEIAAYPFVLRSPESGTRRLIEQRLGRRFEQLAIALELEGNSEIVSCVEAGIGLGLLSAAALARAVALGTVVALELDDVDLTREFALASCADRALSAPAARFADWLANRGRGDDAANRLSA